MRRSVLDWESIEDRQRHWHSQLGLVRGLDPRNVRRVSNSHTWLHVRVYSHWAWNEYSNTPTRSCIGGCNEGCFDSMALARIYMYYGDDLIADAETSDLIVIWFNCDWTTVHAKVVLQVPANVSLLEARWLKCLLWYWVIELCLFSNEIMTPTETINT